MTDNKKLEAEGKAQDLKGKTKDAADEVKKDVKDALDR